MGTVSPHVAYVGGWATHRHVGDDAILRTHLAALTTAAPHARPVVLGREPDVLRERFGVDAAPDLSAYLLAEGPDRRRMLGRLGALIAAAEGRTVPPAGTAETIELLGSARALVDLGAGSLATAYYTVLWSQAAAVAVAAARGVPVLVSGVSVGPVADGLDAIVLGRLLRSASLVTVRDRGISSLLARRLGARDGIEGPDDATGFPSAAGGEDAPFALLAAAPATATALAPAVAALHAEHGLRTVAVAMDFFEQDPDLPALHRLRNALPDPSALDVLDPVPPDAELRALAGRAQVAVGSRYHLAVFAAAAGTPAVLLHHDEYTRAKAEGLASLTEGVVLADSPDAARRGVAVALAAPRPAPLRPTQPLPAVGRLAALLGDAPAAPSPGSEPLGDLEDARALWERLEGDNPFGTWMFADLWWRRLGAGRALHLRAVRVGGEVVALLPLCEQDGELRLLGHVDADLLGPIGPPEHHSAALRALGEHALSCGRRLVADEVPAGSAIALGGKVVRRTPSPVLDIPPEGFEAVLAARSGNLRRGVRNRERRLERAHEVRVRTATEGTLRRDVETLFALHDARWNGSTSVFSGARAALHRELAERALRRGWLRLRLLELDGRPVAANYALRVGASEWYYQAGRDPAFAHASVGLVLQAACIRAACEEGAREYRLLRGDQRYKLSWATRDAPLETVVVEPV